ncbi:hypothetical protein [Bacteriovorax sp. DB6_IX]|uniref:hypothetical protein n=1 Tax=Bacteriovorax sp. DB6_IX TaxID=1353530 RepID=UPI00038A3A95|nr:hypothetical protein [Bacteriovorax sp. DB6_IX]EQC46362.1 hypothetical protein M901_1256 [Bacteriovorax sp. DB6_IX]
MTNQQTPQFPSTEWVWNISINPNQPVTIIHPDGFAFNSPVILNRLDRLNGQNEYQYALTEKDSFLLSYTIDYFQNKSRVKNLPVQHCMILAANLVCAYRFRAPLGTELFDDINSSDDDWRKFGEHLVQVEQRPYEVFVIGHNKGTLIAVTMQDIEHSAGMISKLELIELPRRYFKRYY